MECRITSTASNKSHCAAYTLLEMSVAAGLGCLILAALLYCSVFTARSFAALQNYRDLEAKSRIALSKLSQDIRQVNYLNNFTATSLVFQTTDPTTTNTYVLSYTYNTNALTLTRVYGTNSSIVLSNCTYFHYDLYQRNPSLTNGGDLTLLISTNQPSLVKGIDFTWICQETIYGQTY